MNPYVDLARASLGDAKWEAIVGGDDSDVRAAHNRLVDLVAEHGNASGEQIFYGPTTQLCNCISLAVFDQVRDSRHASDQDVAYIFTIQADSEPKGDFLGLRHKPDYCALSGTRDELMFAAAAPYYARSICWPEMEMVGEQKTFKDNGKGQFKSYLTALKRYRPDIPTVHGFLIHRGQIQLSQLNACGMWSSSRVGVDNLDTWIAFVVHLYQSYQHRDRKLVYNAQQTEFSRWDFVNAPEQTPLILVPFYAAPAPGRVTYASFEVASGDVEPPKVAEAFYGPDVKGFWKTSWQQEGRRSKERELLDHLHAGDRWLPGLVRPYPEMHGDRLRVPTADDVVQLAENAVQREVAEVEALVLEDLDVDVVSTDATAESGTLSSRNSSFSLADVDAEADEDEDNDDADDEHDAGDDEENEGLQDFAAFLTSMPALPPDFVGRTQEILRLASIGEPLSQCESPRHLLFCAYDLLETHIHMWEEGVLHRDVSWFNVLCNPKHYIGDEADAKVRPCIKKILHMLGQEGAGSLPEDSAAVDLMPCALLTDLDHAIAKKELENRKVEQYHGRERTGTAMFISWELSDPLAYEYECLSNQTWAAISRALSTVEEHDLGPAALGRAFPNDHGDFMSNFNKVKTLEASRLDYAPLSERPVHSPRHDAESIYWVFLWAFARAKPRDAAKEASDSVHMDNLADFGNTLLDHTVGRERRRISYRDREKLARLFHPSLAAFEELFRGMAAYLSVPWHLYSNIVKDDHVHVAFRRMILGHVLRTDPKLLDIILDTERPRPVEVVKGLTTERATPIWSEALTAVGGSGRANSQDPLPKIPPEPANKNTLKGGKTAAASADGAGPSSSSTRGGPSVSQSSTGSNKRKARDPGGEPASKRPKTGKGKKMLLADRARQATRYMHELHLRDRSAHALHLKALKDRMFWFSKGH